MRLNFHNSRYLISAPSLKEAPKDGLPHVLFAGRSNVGKSSLINGLTGSKLAFSSKKAGKTKLLNYFLVDKTFYLVDSPGYGATSYANLSTIQFSKMMEDYVKDRSLKAVVLLVDLRRDPGEEDKAFYEYLVSTGVRLISIVTKCDKLNQKERHEATQRALSLGLSEPLFSDLSPKSLDLIRKTITDLL